MKVDPGWMKTRKKSDGKSGGSLKKHGGGLWAHDQNLRALMQRELFHSFYSFSEIDLVISAWDEIHEVFGDGHEYDWALVDDDEAAADENQMKPEMKYQDVRSLFKLTESLPTCVFRFSSHPRYVQGSLRKTTISSVRKTSPRECS